MQAIVVNTKAAKCDEREHIHHPYLRSSSFINGNHHNNRHYQPERWQTDAGVNKISNYRVSGDTNDIGNNDVPALLVQRRDNINKLMTVDDKRNFETALLSDITGNENKRYGNAKLLAFAAKNKRASFPSEYPEIMTDNSGKTLNGKSEQLSLPLVNGGGGRSGDASANFDLNYNSLLNQLSQLQTSGQLASLTNANSGASSSTTAAGNDNGGTTGDRTKANKLTFKTDGIKETADTGINYKCILNEHLTFVCVSAFMGVCED